MRRQKGASNSRTAEAHDSSIRNRRQPGCRKQGEGFGEVPSGDRRGHQSFLLRCTRRPTSCVRRDVEHKAVSAEAFVARPLTKAFATDMSLSPPTARAKALGPWGKDDDKDGSLQARIVPDPPPRPIVIGERQQRLEAGDPQKRFAVRSLSERRK
jgi:hypothetical protein